MQPIPAKVTSLVGAVTYPTNSDVVDCCLQLLVYFSVTVCGKSIFPESAVLYPNFKLSSHCTVAPTLKWQTLLMACAT